MKKEHQFRWVIIILTMFFATGLNGQTLNRPSIFVHYMPWFTAPPGVPYWNHWTGNGKNPDHFEQNGQRQIGSHYYPSIGPYDSSDTLVLEYHTLLMKISGIDGTIIDWYGIGNLHDYPLIHKATKNLIKMLDKCRMQFMICYEDRTITELINYHRIQASEAIQHAKETFSYMDSVWFIKSNYFKYENKPVILNFGPAYFHYASDWTQIFSVLAGPPVFLSIDESLIPPHAGIFSWPPMHLNVNGTLQLSTLESYLDDFNRKSKRWPFRIGTVFPGFHDYYGSFTYGFLDDNQGETYDLVLNKYLPENYKVLQIATWNDFMEGTNIEPTVEYGNRYLIKNQDYVHKVQPDFKYTREDLNLPLELYKQRIHYKGNSFVNHQLDSVFSYAVDGNMIKANSVLNRILASSIIETHTNCQGFNVFPNPTEGNLTITVPAGIGRIDILNTAGLVILAFNQPDLSIKVSFKESGVYYIRAGSGKKSFMKKVVVLKQ